jgi:hypothetical protein
MAFRRGSKNKCGKTRLNLHGTILEESQLVQIKKLELKGELKVWRTKLQA